MSKGKRQKGRHSMPTWDRQMAAFGVGAAVMLASTLCAGQCTKDTDCKGNRVCTNRRCAAPNQCKKDTDCKGDLICTEGACVPPDHCTKDAECRGEGVCKDHRCIAVKPGTLPEAASPTRVERELLNMQIVEARSKRSNAGAVIGLGFGLGAIFLGVGGLTYASSKEKTWPAIILIAGGIELIAGFAGIGAYSHYDSQVKRLERLSATMATLPLSPYSSQQFMLEGPPHREQIQFPEPRWLVGWSFPLSF
jgi:hypothetical protein